MCQVGNFGFAIKQCVCVHASFLAIFICVLDYISETQGDIVLSCHISSRYSFFPLHALQFVFPLCSPTNHLNVVDMMGSDASPCVWTGSQRKGRCLKPGPGFGQLTETHGTDPQRGAVLNELNCSLMKQLCIVQYTV